MEEGGTTEKRDRLAGTRANNGTPEQASCRRSLKRLSYHLSTQKSEQANTSMTTSNRMKHTHTSLANHARLLNFCNKSPTQHSDHVLSFSFSQSSTTEPRSTTHHSTHTKTLAPIKPHIPTVHLKLVNSTTTSSITAQPPLTHISQTPNI